MSRSPQFGRPSQAADNRPTFAVISKARGGKLLGIKHLVRVDKVRHPDAHWWTSDDVVKVMQFRSRAAAQFSADSYEHGNPTVVPYAEAVEILERQSQSIAAARLALKEETG